MTRIRILASVLMDLSQNASISSSISVGDAILGQMAMLAVCIEYGAACSVHGAEVADVPSVLIESAYISNPEDECNLGSSQHQENLFVLCWVASAVTLMQILRSA